MTATLLSFCVWVFFVLFCFWRGGGGLLLSGNSKHVFGFIGIERHVVVFSPSEQTLNDVL